MAVSRRDAPGNFTNGCTDGPSPATPTVPRSSAWRSNQPLRPGDQSVDGWVEYLQTQLKLLGSGEIDIPDSFQPNGVFDEETERYVRAFQHSRHVQVDGVVALRGDHCIGWTDSGQPAGPAEPMKFTFWLERQLTKDEEVEAELTLPDENGGTTFAPGLSGYLQALARGENVD